MRFAFVRLSKAIHSPHEEPGQYSKRDVFTTADGYELEAIGQLLVIRGKLGVEATSLTNLDDGRELQEAEPVKARGRGK